MTSSINKLAIEFLALYLILNLSFSKSKNEWKIWEHLKQRYSKRSRSSPKVFSKNDVEKWLINLKKKTPLSVDAVFTTN